MRMSKRWGWVMLFVPIAFFVIAICVILAVSTSGVYPAGSNTMYHIYRGELIYKSIREGVWYPLIDLMSFNGVENLRYWAPVPAYVMALCRLAAGGDSMEGYLLFVGFVYLLGAFVWFGVGRRSGHPWMGAFFGMLWFLMPANLHVTFVEGNLGQTMCIMLLPQLVFWVAEAVRENTKRRMIGIACMVAVIELCHAGMAALFVIGLLFYLLVDAVIQRKYMPAFRVLPAILSGLLLPGIWLIPSLVGTLSTAQYEETLPAFFQSIFVTLNPWNRFENEGDVYFGLVTFGVAIFGLVCGYKKNAAGFLTGILLVLGSCLSMSQVFLLLPGGEYMWMLRLAPLAMVLIFLQLMDWSTLRKPILIALLILLTIDTVPSFSLFKGEQTGEPVEERLENLADATLISKAHEITKQRLALLDLMMLEANGAYLVSGGENGICASYGVGWEAATIAPNLKQINRALSEGNYYYVFDRALELGNDSVLVKLSEIETGDVALSYLKQAAEAVGYRVAGTSTGYMLFHYDVEGTFGTISRYPAIGIGTGTAEIARIFPAVYESSETNLNQYTYEELIGYECIYLSGFTYDDRSMAEDLIRALSDAGVRIVVLADGIPESKEAHDRSFLGVRCNDIVFENGYPEFDTRWGSIYADMFPQGYTKWKTVYLEGLDDEWATWTDGKLELAFLGTVHNENIVVIGWNLTLHYGLTHDNSIGELLSHALGMSRQYFPERTIVPLTVTQEGNQITVASPYNNVNTGLAYHENAKTTQSIREKNHMVVVDRGTTVVTITYPHDIAGLAVTISGVLLLGLCLWRRTNKRKEHLYGS